MRDRTVGPMISTALVELRGLVLPVLLLVVAACVLGGGLLARSPRGARLLPVLAALAVVPVLLLTLAPTGDPASTGFCTVQLSVPRPGSVEAIANVVLMLPAALLAVLAGLRPSRVLVAGVALSAGIEAVQGAVGALGRACDTNDLAMNTIGVGLGVVLGWATRAIVRRSGGGLLQRERERARVAERRA